MVTLSMMRSGSPDLYLNMVDFSPKAKLIALFKATFLVESRSPGRLRFLVYVFGFWYMDILCVSPKLK